jgi:hypothetical protein
MLSIDKTVKNDFARMERRMYGISNGVADQFTTKGVPTLLRAKSSH